jgi:uncharacterized protein (DUF433 family)
MDENGAIRVGGTRVTLDSLAAAFSDGASAEEIVHRYPSLRLADVYQVIGYLLRHPAEVEAYLDKRRKAAAENRREAENRYDPEGVRDRLLARRSPKQGLP